MFHLFNWKQSESKSTLTHRTKEQYKKHHTRRMLIRCPYDRRPLQGLLPRRTRTCSSLEFDKHQVESDL